MPKNTTPAIERLYTSLINDGWELPELDQFKLDMNNKDNLTKLYNNVVNDGWELPELDVFASDMGISFQPQQQPVEQPIATDKVDSLLEAGGTETAPRQVEPAQEQPLPFSLEKSPEEFFASTRQEAEQQLTTPVVESTISVQPKPVEKTGEEVAQEIKVAEERKASIDIDAKEIMGMPGATDEEIGLYYYDLGSEGDNTRGQDILPSRERITRSLKGKGYTDEEIANYFSLKRYDSLGAEAISNRYRDSKISGKEEKIRSKFSDIMTEDEIKQTALESYVKEYENNSINALLNDIGETDSGDYVVLLNQFMDLREELKGLGEDDQQKRSQLKLELIEIDSKLDAIRESGEAFLNPYTGLRSDADQEAINEAKSKEYDSTIEEVKDLPFDQLQKAHNKIYNEYFSLLEENPNFSREGIQSNEEGIQLLMDEKRYKEQLAISEARFNAINRAYILNEDVTKQDRSGFFGSLAKTLLEETVAPALGLPEATGATDEIVNFVNTLKEENFDLTPEQESQAELLFSEKAGSAVGTTIPIIVEFLATRKVADPIILNKWNKIDDVVKASLKDSKVSRGAYSILSSGVKESILFELAPSEQVSGVMGFAEGATQEALDLMDVGGWILKKGAGKYAKFLEFGVKTTAGTISEGFAELAGEYTDQLVETGFDTEKAFENAFGRTGDEILDNILLTTIISGGMSGASNIGVAVKGLEQLKARGFKKTQEVYNEMPQSTKDGMNEEMKSKLEDIGIEIEETKIEEDVTETAEEVTPTKVGVQEEVAVDEDIQPQPEGIQEEDVQDVPETAVEEEVVEDIELTTEVEPSLQPKATDQDLDLDTKDEANKSKILGILDELSVEEETTQEQVSETEVDEEIDPVERVYKSMYGDAAEEVLEIRSKKAKYEEEAEAMGLNPWNKDFPNNKNYDELDTRLNEIYEQKILSKEKVTEEDLDTLEQEIDNTSDLDDIQKTEKKKVVNISKAVKGIVPGVEFVFHRTNEEYNNSTDQDVSDSRGYRDGNKVHINLSEVKDNTSFHEAIHPVLEAVADQNPEFYSKMAEQVKNDPEFKEYINDALSEYTDENTSTNEAMTEMLADMASGKYEKGSTIYEKTKNLLNGLVTSLGLSKGKFNVDLNDETQLKDFAKTVSEALATGNKITFNKKAPVIENAKQATKFIGSMMSKSSMTIYEAVNKTREITAKGIKRAIKASKEFAAKFKKLMIALTAGITITTGAVNLNQEGMLKGWSYIPSDLQEVIEGEFEESSDSKGKIDRANFLTKGESSSVKVDSKSLQEKEAKLAKEAEAKKKYIEEHTYFNTGEAQSLPGTKYKTRNTTNQFPADSGFVYIAAPNRGSVDAGGDFSIESEGVAQFLLDASVADNQSFNENNSSTIEGHYSHKFNDAFFEVDKKRDGFVPVFEKLGDNQVRVTYKKFSELESSDKMLSPLRQYSFSDIDWNGALSTGSFNNTINIVPLKKGVKNPYPGKNGSSETDFVFAAAKGKNHMGKYEGFGAVFIFEDNNGVRWVREFNGSINQIKAMGENIIKNYGISPSDLTIGHHDVGSFSARPIAENGKVSTKFYKNFNTAPETGGALYYPPKGIQQQKKGLGKKAASSQEIINKLKDYVNKGMTLNQAIDSVAKENNIDPDSLKESLFNIPAKRTAEARAQALKDQGRQADVKPSRKTTKVPEGVKTTKGKEAYKKADKAKRKTTKAPAKAAKKISRKKKTRIEVDESKALIDQIKLEAKAAKEGAKSVRDQVDLMNDKINEFISDNKDRLKNIPKEKISQISRIFNKRIATPAAFNDAISKIEEILDIGEFNKKVRIADNLNKKIKTGSSDARKAMEVLKNMSPSLMGEELLEDYIELVQSTNPGRKQVAPSLEVLQAFKERYDLESNPPKFKPEKKLKTKEEIDALTEKQKEAREESKKKAIESKKSIDKNKAKEGRHESQQDIIDDLMSITEEEMDLMTKPDLDLLNSVYEEINNGRLKQEAYYEIVRPVKLKRSMDSYRDIMSTDKRGRKKPNKIKDLSQKLKDVNEVFQKIVKEKVNTSLGDLFEVNNEILNSEIIKKITQNITKAKNQIKIAKDKIDSLYKNLNKGNFVTDSIARQISGKRANINMDRDIRRVARSIALDMYAVQKMHEDNGGTGDNVKARLDKEPTSNNKRRAYAIYEALISKYGKDVDGETVLDTEAMFRDMPQSMRDFYSGVRKILDNDLSSKAYNAQVYYRGKNISMQESYVPIVPSDWTPDAKDYDALDSGNINHSNPSARAAATKEKKGVDTPHRWGLYNNVLKNVKDVNMDYYVTPSLQTDVRALKQLAKDNVSESVVWDALNKTVNEIIKTEVIFGSDNGLSKAYNKFASLINRRAYQRSLDSSARLVIEPLANMLLVGDPSLLKDMWSSPIISNLDRNKADKKKWFDMMNKYGSSVAATLGRDPLESEENSGVFSPKAELNNSMMEGVWDFLQTNKISKLAALSSELNNSTADKIIRLPYWMSSFQKNYKKETGKDFDINDQSNRQAIEKAIRMADTEVAKVISPSGSEEVALRQKNTGKKYSSLRSLMFDNAQTFMTNFAFNQYNRATSAIKNFPYDPYKSSTELFKIMSSNMFYNIAMQSIMAVIRDFTDDESDEWDRMNNIIESMQTGEYWLRQFVSAGLTTYLGRFKLLGKSISSLGLNTLNNMVTDLLKDRRDIDDIDLDYVYKSLRKKAEKTEQILYSPNPSAFGGYGDTREAWKQSFGSHAQIGFDLWDASAGIIKSDDIKEQAALGSYLMQATVGMPLAKDVKTSVPLYEKKKKKKGKNQFDFDFDFDVEIPNIDL